MDLRPDPLQLRLRDAVDTVLTRTGEPSAHLAAVGVPALNAPERLGGLALGLGADIVVNERLGYGLEPFGGHRQTAFALDLLDGDDTPADDLEAVLADLYAGTRHAAVVGARGPADVRPKPGGRLWGESETLPRGDIGLCVVRTADGEWRLVVPEDDTCVREDVDHFGTPATRLRFDGAASRPLACGPDRWERALAAARIRQAALLLGIANRITGAARAHVNSRTQSGKALVERQTVAHRLALLVGEGEGWRLLLHKAAWEYDRGELPDAAAVLAVAAEHAQLASRTALQLHGVRGMLAHSTAARVYRLVAVESVRMGTPTDLWREAASDT
ncbi:MULTISPECIES: acyl-CoA dehydrogenase family protein [unclassified Streptomyces]|uniref:acyl-CoA dehydrogenase family protein n=1 Tax=unclassified Streptomyces TaxID=2593676 RepID=UPI0004C2D186